VKEIGKLRTGKMTLPTGGIHAADKWSAAWRRSAV
jgi:hypothetical protein